MKFRVKMYVYVHYKIDGNQNKSYIYYYIIYGHAHIEREVGFNKARLLCDATKSFHIMKLWNSHASTLYST